MISLLYQTQETKKKFSDETMDSLMLDKTLSLLLPENELRNNFSKILSEPLIDIENIEYRQMIFKDFTVNRALLNTLSNIFEQFFSVVMEYNKTKQNVKQIYGRTASTSNGMGISTLRSVANLINKLLFLIKKMSLSFEGLLLCSKGLKELCHRLRDITASEGFSKLWDISKRFGNISISNLRADIVFVLNENSQLTEVRYCEIFSENPNKNQKKDTKKRGLFNIQRKSKEDIVLEKCIPLQYNSFTVNKVVGQSISDVTDILIDISNQILSEFMGIKEEIMFYKAGCRIRDKLCELDIPVSFPMLDKKTEIYELYDLFLLFHKPRDVQIISNDFFMSIDYGGMLIRGDNGNGKTVYLRSIATAYIFAQSGLPIPAKYACVCPISYLEVLMASSEKTLDIMNDAGRFEEEVIKISKVVNNPIKNSILMINEFFQTTSYIEGAQSLYYILQYLSACSIKWICVTHLSDLFDFFSDNKNICKIEMKNYKAENITCRDKNIIDN